MDYIKEIDTLLIDDLFTTEENRRERFSKAFRSGLLSEPELGKILKAKPLNTKDIRTYLEIFDTVTEPYYEGNDINIEAISVLFKSTLLNSVDGLPEAITKYRDMEAGEGFDFLVNVFNKIIQFSITKTSLTGRAGADRLSEIQASNEKILAVSKRRASIQLNDEEEEDEMEDRSRKPTGRKVLPARKRSKSVVREEEPEPEVHSGRPEQKPKAPEGFSQPRDFSLIREKVDPIVIETLNSIEVVDWRTFMHGYYLLIWGAFKGDVIVDLEEIVAKYYGLDGKNFPNNKGNVGPFLLTMIGFLWNNARVTPSEREIKTLTSSLEHQNGWAPDFLMALFWPKFIERSDLIGNQSLRPAAVEQIAINNRKALENHRRYIPGGSKYLDIILQTSSDRFDSHFGDKLKLTTERLAMVEEKLKEKEQQLKKEKEIEEKLRYDLLDMGAKASKYAIETIALTKERDQIRSDLSAENTEVRKKLQELTESSAKLQASLEQTRTTLNSIVDSHEKATSDYEELEEKLEEALVEVERLQPGESNAALQKQITNLNDLLQKSSDKLVSSESEMETLKSTVGKLEKEKKESLDVIKELKITLEKDDVATRAYVKESTKTEAQIREENRLLRLNLGELKTGKEVLLSKKRKIDESIEDADEAVQMANDVIDESLQNPVLIPKDPPRRVPQPTVFNFTPPPKPIPETKLDDSIAPKVGRLDDNLVPKFNANGWTNYLKVYRLTYPTSRPKGNTQEDARTSWTRDFSPAEREVWKKKPLWPK